MPRHKAIELAADLEHFRAMQTLPEQHLLIHNFLGLGKHCAQGRPAEQGLRVRCHRVGGCGWRQGQSPGFLVLGVYGAIPWASS